MLVVVPPVPDDVVTTVRVWHAPLWAMDPAWRSLLDSADLARIARLRRAGDRARTTLGIVLVRLAVAAELGAMPHRVTLRRVCGRCAGPHGKPEVDGAEVSIAHSADLVAVAVSRTAAVGLDVEVISRFAGAIPSVLGADESAGGAAEMATSWCRKEALVKASGDGVTVPLREVRVTPPGMPAALVAYRERQLAAVLVDLALRAGYMSAVAVLTEQPVTLEIIDAQSIVAMPPQTSE